MIAGIVGAEAKKFTELGAIRAIAEIRKIVGDPKIQAVTSGACHLGGIDIWAEEVADDFHKCKFIYPAAIHRWTGTIGYPGYQDRNILIAKKADFVVCITVKNFPKDYDDMKFTRCYHCAQRGRDKDPYHIKSGGCWTMWHAIEKLGKVDGSKVIVIDNF